MGTRAGNNVNRLAASIKNVAKEAEKAAKFMGRMKGGGQGGGSRRPVVITDIRTPRGSYYDENARALGL